MTTTTEEIRERRSKITKEKWAQSLIHPDNIIALVGKHWQSICLVTWPWNGRANAEFIAHAPEFIDHLLEEVKRLGEAGDYHKDALADAFLRGGEKSEKEIERLRKGIQKALDYKHPEVRHVNNMRVCILQDIIKPKSEAKDENQSE